MTDDTLTRYATAAASLPDATVREAITLAGVMAAHDDDASDAIPYAVIALAAAAESGTVLPVRTAIGVALRGAERDRFRRTNVTRPTDWDAVASDPEQAHRVPVAAPLITRPDSPRWEDVRERIPASDRVMLDGIADRGIRRIVAERAAGWRTLPNGETVGTPPDAPIPLTRRALRVGDIAAAVGAPIPRSRAASDALRAAACVAWSGAASHLVSAIVTPRTGERTVRTAETVAERAVRCMAYVTTDAAALSAGYRRERDLVAGAAPGTTSPETVRRLGWVAPVADPVSGSLIRSMPEPKKGAARRSRKGLVTPSTSTRYGGGVGESTAHGATVSGTRTGSTDARAVAIAGRRIAADEAAAHSHALAAVAGGRICTRALPVPTTDVDGSGWECGCGGSALPVLSGWVMSGAAGTGRPVREIRHALIPCTVPLVSDDGARCGCGRKRGALTRQAGDWAHRAR